MSEINSHFRFVSFTQHKLTPDLEQEISSAQAWASIIPTQNEKPNSQIVGAFVTESYEELKQEVSTLKEKVNSLEQKIDSSEQEINSSKQKAQDMEKQIKHERKKREESDMVLASHVAVIENTLKENKLLEDKLGRISDAYSTLYYCQICFENERRIRFTPCGHIVSCAQCAETIMQEAHASSRRCPVCRAVIIDTETSFVT